MKLWPIEHFWLTFFPDQYWSVTFYKIHILKHAHNPSFNKVTSCGSDSSHHEPIHAAILYHGDPQATF